MGRIGQDRGRRQASEAQPLAALAIALAADPGERDNAYGREPGIAAELRAKLEAHLAGR